MDAALLELSKLVNVTYEDHRDSVLLKHGQCLLGVLAAGASTFGHRVSTGAVVGERLVHANDDVLRLGVAPCLLEILFEPVELLGPKARISHVVERDEVKPFR